MGAPTKIADRFAILREIGEGAFAHVYRALDESTGRTVALKVLKESLRGDDEALERFRREAFAVASIDSPHVVSLFDFGTTGDAVFIALEFVEGPSLRDVLTRPMGPDATRVIVGQIAQALAAAHKHDILHRDLKPENVMLVRGAHGRQVKVLDFGLAKLADLEHKLELAALTRAGMCFGTPQYMAPELIEGQAADRSTDLWALGVTAYEMLTGLPPWSGGDVRTILHAVLGEPLPLLARSARGLARAAELDRFFAWALERDRGKRPTDAIAFFRRFEEALVGNAPPASGDAAFASILAASVALPSLGDETFIDPQVSLSDTVKDLRAVSTLSAMPVVIPEPPAGVPLRPTPRQQAVWMASVTAHVQPRPRGLRITPGLVALLVLAGVALGAVIYYVLVR